MSLFTTPSNKILIAGMILDCKTYIEGNIPNPDKLEPKMKISLELTIEP